MSQPLDKLPVPPKGWMDRRMLTEMFPSCWPTDPINVHEIVIREISPSGDWCKIQVINSDDDESDRWVLMSRIFVIELLPPIVPSPAFILKAEKDFS